MAKAPHRIPIVLLTGFLGSGKTTLLNKLLRSEAAGDIAVVVNEFGEIGIDNALIESHEGNTVLLESGCVCCSVRDSLASTIDELFQKRTRGSVPAYRHLVMETTGLADPGPILHVLGTDSLVAAYHHVAVVAATVDCVNAWHTLSAHQEAVKQVALANQIFLTKTDMVSVDATPQLQLRLREINAFARVFNANTDDWIAPLLSDTSYSLETPRTYVFSKVDEREHLDGISTFGVESKQAISWAQLAEFLRQLNALSGDELLRVKGLVMVEGQNRPVVIHGVQQLIHSPTLLPAWPRDPLTQIVFIVRDPILARAEEIARCTFGSQSG